MAAYFIIHNRITDPATMAEYIPKAIATLEPYGTELLVLDEQTQVVEGTCEFPRTIVIKFKSREDAETWYASPEYRAVCPLRLKSTEGFGVLVDGWEPPAS